MASATTLTLWGCFSIWGAPSLYSSQHIYNQLLNQIFPHAQFTGITNQPGAACASSYCFLNSMWSSAATLIPGSCALHTHARAFPSSSLHPEVLFRDYPCNCIIFPKAFEYPTTRTDSFLIHCTACVSLLAHFPEICMYSRFSKWKRY